jgi:hypothetical protein
LRWLTKLFNYRLHWSLYRRIFLYFPKKMFSFSSNFLFSHFWSLKWKKSFQKLYTHYTHYTFKTKISATWCSSKNFSKNNSGVWSMQTKFLYLQHATRLNLLLNVKEFFLEFSEVKPWIQYFIYDESFWWIMINQHRKRLQNWKLTALCF